MLRDSESRLLAFCVQQHGQFAASAWRQFTAVSPAELAAAARYLSGVAWYGHQPALRAVADSLGEKSFAALVLETGFDPGRFGGLLRAHLRQAGQAFAA